MDILIVTNNPEVADSNKNKGRVLNIYGGAMEVFLAARELVYQGYSLLSHPLMGSIRPWQNPYRSIVLQKSSPPVRGRNISLIENAVAMLADNKEALQERFSSIETQTLAEYRWLDKELINQVWDRGSEIWDMGAEIREVE